VGVEGGVENASGSEEVVEVASVLVVNVVEALLLQPLPVDQGVAVAGERGPLEGAAAQELLLGVRQAEKDAVTAVPKVVVRLLLVLFPRKEGSEKRRVRVENN